MSLPPGAAVAGADVASNDSSSPPEHAVTATAVAAATAAKDAGIRGVRGINTKPSLPGFQVGGQPVVIRAWSRSAYRRRRLGHAEKLSREIRRQTPAPPAGAAIYPVLRN